MNIEFTATSKGLRAKDLDTGLVAEKKLTPEFLDRDDPRETCYYVFRKGTELAKDLLYEKEGKDWVSTWYGDKDRFESQVRKALDKMLDDFENTRTG